MENAAATVTAEHPADHDRMRELPPIEQPTLDIEKVEDACVSNEKLEAVENEATIATAEHPADHDRMRELPPIDQPTLDIEKVEDVSNEKLEAVEGATAIVTAEHLADHDCMRELPPIDQPTLDINKVEQVEAEDTTRLEKIADEKLEAVESAAVEAKDMTRLPNEKLEAVKSTVAMVTVENPVDRPRELPAIYRPTIDINKVKKVVAKDMARLKKIANAKMEAKEKLARELLKLATEKLMANQKLDAKDELAKKILKLANEKLMVREKFAAIQGGPSSSSKLETKEKLAKEKVTTEKLTKRLAKGKMLVKEKLAAIEGGPSCSSNTVATMPISSARSILLGKTKSAIAFEILIGSKCRQTVVLSARVPRCLRRLDSPPQLTAEVLTAKQLAARENRLKELERVRDCARACARRPAGKNSPVNDT